MSTEDTIQNVGACSVIDSSGGNASNPDTEDWNEVNQVRLGPFSN